MDAISEARLKDVHPVLAAKIRQMDDMLREEKIGIRVVQGLRSWNQQEALYAQGRTAPGPIVTNCRGGYSYHNFGLAVDCVPDEVSDDGKFTPDWNEKHHSWKRMIAVAESLGLHCGADWKTFKDYPHFQLNGRFPDGAPNEEVRQLFRDGGIQAAWDESQIA